MTLKPTLPPHFVAFAPDDSEFWFRADYEPGEDQWFDARSGVGSPGHGPSVEVNEISVDQGATWAAPDAFPHLSTEAMEQQVHDFVRAQAEAFWEEYAERQGRQL